MQNLKFKWFILGLLLIIVGLIIEILIKQKDSPRFGTIEPHTLIANRVRNLVNLDPDQNLSSEEIQKVAAIIKTVIGNYAKEHNLIIFTKNEILSSNLVDYTPQIIEAMESSDVK